MLSLAAELSFKLHEEGDNEGVLKRMLLQRKAGKPLKNVKEWALWEPVIFFVIAA